MKRFMLVVLLSMVMAGCANKPAMMVTGAGAGAAGGAFVGSKLAGTPGALVGAAGGGILGAVTGFFIADSVKPTVQVPSVADARKID